ncbi:MAG: diguanylate cyclase [Giesbergeria sp.]
MSEVMMSGFGDSLASPSQLGRRKSDRSRLRRPRSTAQKWLVALLLLAAFISVALVFRAMGYVQTRTLLVLVGLMVAGTSGFLLLFQTGLNLKFREKRLKLPIVTCALASLLWMVYLDPAMQILLAPFTFVSLAYGMYRISRNTTLRLALGVVVGYAFVIAMHFLEGSNWALLKLEFMHFIALSAALPGFAYLTGKAPLLHMVLSRTSRKMRTIEADAQIDPMLGCFNRRYIVAALEEKKQLADETGEPLCIAIVDLDHFKRINDDFGHLAGDEVLRSFVRVTQQSVRDEDVFGRYGGEEFLLIFPGTSLLPALNTCERVRAQVEAHDWGDEMRGRVSVSIGVTQYLEGESVLEFFARADTATYLAKEGGRNQVVVEEPVDRRASNDVFGDGEAEVDSRLPDGESNSDFALLEEAGFVKERRAALL